VLPLDPGRCVLTLVAVWGVSVALRPLRGLLRRLSGKPVRLDPDTAAIDPLADFSMTQSSTDAGAVTLRLYGEIDLNDRDSLRNRLIAIIDIDHADQLLVDLDGVTFLDCSGIGALIAGRNAAQAAGSRYEVRNPRGFVSTILWACGVDMVSDGDQTPPTTESFAV
jgi:anti-anti-sigma factor